MAKLGNVIILRPSKNECALIVSDAICLSHQSVISLNLEAVQPEAPHELFLGRAGKVEAVTAEASHLCCGFLRNPCGN
jgi:hypothetical protein